MPCKEFGALCRQRMGTQRLQAAGTQKRPKRKIESAFVFVCFASWRLCVQMNCTKEVLKNELARFNLRSPLDDDETNFRPIALQLGIGVTRRL